MRFLQSINIFQKRKEPLYTPPERGQEDLFPFEAINMGQIPVEVRELLEKRRKDGSRLRNSVAKPWEEVLKVGPRDITTYIATHRLDFAESRMSHFVDLVSGKIAGEGALIYTEMLKN
ncbi:MAG: hypothetical protein AAB899_04665, partial [Patescibacteria group bacterium]